MADGSKIALFDAPGDLPVKLAFRTGIKHVAAKDARPEKRVVLMNAVEATEAPESRRVSDADLFFFFCTVTLRVIMALTPNPPALTALTAPPGWFSPPPTTCLWNASLPVPHTNSRHVFCLMFSHQLPVAPYESADCSANARFVRQPEGCASAISPDSPEAGAKGKRAAASPAGASAKRSKRG